MQRALTIAVLGFLVAPTRPAVAADWEEINHEEGITVWSRDVANSSIVEFRGRGVVEAPLIRIAAVIRNSARKPEWIAHCAEERALHMFNPGHAIVYNRTKSPNFLVSDRDVVIDASATVMPERQMVRIDFHSVTDPKMPPVDGAVRIPRVNGFWLLHKLDDRNTEVTYQVQADPGGAIPTWLVNYVQRKLPLNTLLGLRKQSNKPGYEQDVALLEAAYDWSRFDGTQASAGHAP
jgi:hypothetical protein